MKKNTLRSVTSITLMVFGTTFVLAASLFWTNYALSASQSSNTLYLESTVIPTLSVHSLQISASPTPFMPLTNESDDQMNNPVQQGAATVLQEDPDGTQENDQEPPQEGSDTSENNTSTGDPALEQIQPDQTGEESQPVQEGEITPEQPPDPDSEQDNGEQVDLPLLEAGQPVVQEPITDTLNGSATPGTEDASDPDQSITNTVGISETFTLWEPSPPLVRISIPALKVKRPIVDIGWINKKGSQDWDTDSLFANQNRQDLVGHLEGTAYPGEGENIVLVGHNYDWGIYQWEGVFAKVKKLSQGDKIKLYTEGGDEHIYYVEDVKVISFANNNKNLAKHARLLGLTNSERLTLVTCGGANIGLWNKRVYVIAVPLDQYGELEE